MVAALDAKTKQNTRCTNLCYSLHTVNRHAKSTCRSKVCV